MKNNFKTIKLQVDGMTCSNCALGIKRKLEDNGLTKVDVNFTTGETTCEINKIKNETYVRNIIKELGYTIIDNQNLDKSFSKSEKYFYLSIIFTTPLFLHMFFPKNTWIYNPLLQFSLCLPVYIIGLVYFGKSALKSILNGLPNMDVLIFIGSTSAFIYSIYSWIIFYGTNEIHQYLFFETTATIITLVLLGNVLESKSIKKTTSAIKYLSEIQKINAKKEINGKIEEIEFNKIQLNDILIINNGDKIPTDGIIISGDCLINESMITGESLPLKKSEGNKVIGGTIVTDGSIRIKATKIGSQTILSQIIKLVEDAQKSKPKIQRIGDKVSGIFVPIVILISFSTFIFGYYYFNISQQDAILRSIAVLVISCPCAMGLATPTAIMVGIGRAARNGILIKGGDTLEKLANIKNIVFDKTGTITTGDFKVSDFNTIIGETNEIKNIIYNIEKHSSHPIAKSLCNEFKEFSDKLEISEIHEEKGLSISAKINNHTYSVGSSKITTEKQNCDLYVTKNNQLIATINIKDEIKEGTQNIISTLNKNHTTILLSGDNAKKCQAVTKELNINKTLSNQSPIDKITKIEKLVNTNPTIMIGDGINDAPALSKSTIGISLGNATQIAIQSSEIILLNNKSLEQLPKALQIGKHTLLTIKQNLFWAFSYNIIAIPIAIAGLLNPMWAALFMAFSDVVVIGNSIRLRYKRIFY